MTLIDHLFVLAFAVAQPIIGLVSFRRFVRRIKEGATADLNHLYLTTMLGHWAMFCVAIAIWFGMFTDNPASARVLEKVGFRYLGEETQYSVARAQDVPIRRYKIEF